METPTSEISAYIGFLRNSLLWPEASEKTLANIAGAMQEESFGPGEFLIRINEPGRKLFVLTAGEVQVRIPGAGDESALVATLGPPECFGEMSLLTGDFTSANVVAALPCKALTLVREDFRRLVSSDPGLLQDFICVLARRLKNTGMTVARSHLRRRELTQLLALEGEEGPESLVGSAMKSVTKLVERFSQAEEPVMILGERGTGRQLVARLIHSNSSRKDRVLLCADCGQIVQSEWGDRLFGSYSDLDSPRSVNSPISYLEIVEDGTLLLKDVETLPVGVQKRFAKLVKRLSGLGERQPRIVATSSLSEKELSESGLLDPGFLDLFSSHRIVLPPLRERKRDIPQLADHFVERQAQRLERPVVDIDEAAVSKLVSYDYPYGNVAELEEAMERAVRLADGPTIQSEEIFLGPPPRQEPGGFNLLGLPERFVKPAIKWLRRVARIGAALVFSYILFDCFFGPSDPSLNLGNVLVWSVWWPVLILSFFFVGRAWCAVCPMSAAGKGVGGLLKQKLKIPNWVKQHDTTIVMVGFFSLIWVEEAVNMRNLPRATGFLLLAILIGAVALSLYFPRRTWCRHVCPLGALAGVSATTSILELRPTADICSAQCKGHSCFKGEGDVEGCPLFNHVMFVDSNRNCVLCMQCVEACPNHSPQLNLRIPGRELWTAPGVWQESRRFVVLLLGILAGVVLIQATEEAPGGWARDLLSNSRVAFVTGVLVICAGLPLLWLEWKERVVDPVKEKQAAWWNHLGVFVPLLVAGFAAYQLAYVPGLAWLHAGFGRGDQTDPTDFALAFSVLSSLRAVLLVVGLVGALLVVAKLKEGRESPKPAGIRSAVLAASAYWAWLFFCLVVQ